MLGFDWSSISQDAVVVDVGGGLGAPSMILAKEFPELRIIIQDRQPVVQQAQMVSILSQYLLLQTS